MEWRRLLILWQALRPFLCARAVVLRRSSGVFFSLLTSESSDYILQDCYRGLQSSASIPSIDGRYFAVVDPPRVAAPAYTHFTGQLGVRLFGEFNLLSHCLVHNCVCGADVVPVVPLPNNGSLARQGLVAITGDISWHAECFSRRVPTGSWHAECFSRRVPTGVGHRVSECHHFW